jgi:hypothetical protein
MNMLVRAGDIKHNIVTNIMSETTGPERLRLQQLAMLPEMSGGVPQFLTATSTASHPLAFLTEFPGGNNGAAIASIGLITYLS